MVLCLAALVAFASPARPVDLSKCEMCHKPAGPAPVPPAGLYASPHAGMGCLECHPGARQPHREGVATLGCAACHPAAAKALAASVHGGKKSGTPTCRSCHGGGHSVSPPSGAAFKPSYAPKICARCHPDVVD
jgi:hypothetical protein